MAEQNLALVVDDSKSARLVLKRMLERHALHVDTVESAAEALDYLLHNRPDVIFMDYMMPDQQRAEDAEQKLELQLEHTRQQLYSQENLGWGTNQSLQYAYDEIALDNQRVDIMEALVKPSHQQKQPRAGLDRTVIYRRTCLA